MNAAQGWMVALFSAGSLCLTVSGCNREEVPAKTQADVSKAQVEGAKKVEEARHEAAQDTIQAQQDVSRSNTELAHETAQGNYNVAIAKAEADHKVSLQACDAMSGDARDACRKQADVALFDSKAAAAPSPKRMTRRARSGTAFSGTATARASPRRAPSRTITLEQDS
jgi:hypothetical protein